LIQKISFKEFKSFDNSEIELKHITVLIGSNGSGKSNAIDGLRILSGSTTGTDLALILDGARGGIASGIRGGSKGCPRFGTDSFTIGVSVGPINEQIEELTYELGIAVKERIFVDHETLKEVRVSDKQRRDERILFQTVNGITQGTDISVEYDNGKRGFNPRFECLKSVSVLSQVGARLPSKTNTEKHIHEMAAVVIEQLRKVLFLDPIPHEMRDYVPHTSLDLSPSASNLSAVIAKLIQHDSSNKKRILQYLKQLPDQEVVDIDIVKTPLGDVMLRIKERTGSKAFWVDARGLSDGTLRSLAIVAAILAEDRGSMVVIEELDNGLHPAKAKGILSLLSDLSAERDIQLLVTTHNPALLNAMHGNEVAGVVVCYRDPAAGDSRFRALVHLDAYLRIASNERIGDAMESGEITRAVRGEESDFGDDAIDWLRSLS
jgi:predicted ATPase